jgi:hypothetical protein
MTAMPKLSETNALLAPTAIMPEPYCAPFPRLPPSGTLNRCTRAAVS